MEDLRSARRSISTSTRANETLSLVAVNLSHCKGLPRTLANFDKHLGVQHFNGRLGNFNQTGTWDISELEKSKYSDIGRKIRGLPYTRYGPPHNTEILSSSFWNL
jgi:hypothetical protein